MTDTYSSMGLGFGFVCYEGRVLLFPHVVYVSAFEYLYCLLSLYCWIYMCSLYVSLGSRVSPSIFGLMFMGSVLLSICSSSWVLYSARSGVKRVHVV